MKNALLLSAVIFVVGCHKNTGAPEVTDASAVAAPAPATGTPPADSAPAPTMDDAQPVPEPESGETPTAGGGRMAKPGWCDKDEDCSKGSVCEKCGAEGQCVPGCHNNAQCEAGEYCNQVQCIRCPCPGICEKKS